MERKGRRKAQNIYWEPFRIMSSRIFYTDNDCIVLFAKSLRSTLCKNERKYDQEYLNLEFNNGNHHNKYKKMIRSRFEEFQYLRNTKHFDNMAVCGVPVKLEWEYNHIWEGISRIVGIEYIKVIDGSEKTGKSKTYDLHIHCLVFYDFSSKLGAMLAAEDVIERMSLPFIPEHQKEFMDRMSQIFQDVGDEFKRSSEID
jgi:hypothetical protein